MKTAIVTPTGEHSAIALSTRNVVLELLGLGIEVTVVSSESVAPEKNLDFQAPLVGWQEIDRLRKLGPDTKFIYQMGDNYEFHQGALHLIHEIPGVVVLHDAYLGHLASRWNLERPKDIHSYAYRSNLHNVHSVKKVVDFEHADFHLSAGYINIFSEYATGIITHSQWSARIAQTATDLPVQALKLPWSGLPILDQNLVTRSEAFNVLTVGNINSNKKCDAVIQAIGRIGEKSILYTLAGFINGEEKQRLDSMASSLGVNLKILGVVSETQLREELLRADLVTNLRYPVLEGASASLLDAFSLARPTVVVNHGHYSELPNDSVFKVSPNEIEGALEVLFRQLITSEITGKKVGIAARNYFTSHHDTKKYASDLLNFLDFSTNYEPLIRARNQIYKLDEDLFLKFYQRNHPQAFMDKFTSYLSHAVTVQIRKIIIRITGNPCAHSLIKRLYKRVTFLEPLVSKALRSIGVY